MKYRKKPVVIEAIKHTRNYGELQRFLGESFISLITERHPNGKSEVRIKTLDSVAIAVEGDWICKGVQGEFYPCKPDIFEQTYELVEGS